HSRAENDFIVLLQRNLRKERVLQLSSAVISPEVKAEGVFIERKLAPAIIILATDIPPTVDPNARIDLESAVILRADQFHRNGAFPGDSMLRGIGWFHDAGRPVKIVRGGHE